MYKQKQLDFLLGFKLCIKMIFIYVMKDKTELIDIPFYVKQYVGKRAITGFSHSIQCIVY